MKEGKDGMTEIGADRVFEIFEEKMTAAAEVDSGEVVRFHTQDCYGNLLVNEGVRRQDLVGKAPQYNPTTGPVYVRGAKRGDTLKVEILKIRLADHGTMRLTPGVGALRDAVTEEQVKILEIKDGKICFDGVELPVDPMIGVIGVAPLGGAWDTDTPHRHGGNMDNRTIGEGCTVYFPVGQDGAYFGLGDVHGLMGDGEVCICGLECEAQVDVRLTVIPGRCEEWPVWEKDGLWSVMCSAEDLDEAAELARYAMLDFLRRRTGWKAQELVMLLSLIGDTAVCQVVDPLATVRFTLRRPVFALEF